MGQQIFRVIRDGDILLEVAAVGRAVKVMRAGDLLLAELVPEPVELEPEEPKPRKRASTKKVV